MSKKRLIGALLVRDGIVVQSIGFQRYLPVGDPRIAVRFLDTYGVDEILLLDITARREGRTVNNDMVAACAAACHVPLCVGGGIASVEDVRNVVRAGADKVAINGQFFREREAIPGIVAEFGAQCVIGAMDVLRDGKEPQVVDANRQRHGIVPSRWAAGIAELGAGEILINSIERDGSGEGYDLEVINDVAAAVALPVIALGGAGNAGHVQALFEHTRARAAAVGNALHFTEHSVAWIKSCLVRQETDLRLDSQADYRHIGVGPFGRVARRDDSELTEELFTFIPPEVI